MRSRKGEEGFGTIKSIVIVLALVVMIIFVFRQQIGYGKNALNACEERGGYRCVETCSGKGSELWPAGKGACEEAKGDDYVCCTSDQIKEADQANTILSGGSEITLKVNDRPTSYYYGEDNPPVMAGKEENLQVKIDDKYVDNDYYCWVHLYNARTDQVVDNGVKGTCEETMDFTHKFTQQERNSNLKLRALIYEGTEIPEDTSSYDMSATFDLDINSPIRVSLKDGWSKSNTAEVRCLLGSCSDLKYRILEDGDECLAQPQNDDLPRSDSENNISFNQEGRGIIEFNEDKFEEGSVVDNFLCVKAKLDNGDLVSEKSYGTLRLDYAGPTVKPTLNEEGLLECEDKGSGCDTIYYDIPVYTTPGDIEEVSDGDDLTETILNRVVFNPIQSYSCVKGVGSFTTTYTGRVNTRNYVAGAICAYAVDNAGNTGPVQKVFFKNDDQMKPVFANLAQNLLNKWT